MIDVLANKVSLCLRGQGGHNAGHTIVANGVTYDFHLIPSGLLNPTCVNLIGSGCVFALRFCFGTIDLMSKPRCRSRTIFLQGIREPQSQGFEPR
jgi:adenylosuccinate synthase